MKSDNEKLVSQIIAETAGFEAEKLLAYVVGKFGGKVALASSFGAEDQVLTDMLCNVTDEPVIFTLDTGRVPQESYDTAQRTREKYGIMIEFLFPDYRKVEEMENQFGPNLFYESIENRKLCCKIRKIEPLKRKLAGLDAWICGLRAQQSVTRTAQAKVEWDHAFDLIKICPLADWSTEHVWEYIREHDVPYNKLHDKGYPSIGCEPCTRAVKPGEDIRAGRWWWEEPIHKECGLHLGKEAENKQDDKK